MSWLLGSILGRRMSPDPSPAPATPVEPSAPPAATAPPPDVEQPLQQKSITAAYERPAERRSNTKRSSQTVVLLDGDADYVRMRDAVSRATSAHVPHHLRPVPLGLPLAGLSRRNSSRNRTLSTSPRTDRDEGAARRPDFGGHPRARLPVRYV